MPLEIVFVCSYFIIVFVALCLCFIMAGYAGDKWDSIEIEDMLVPSFLWPFTLLVFIVYIIVIGIGNLFHALYGLGALIGGKRNGRKNNE